MEYSATHWKPSTTSHNILNGFKFEATGDEGHRQHVRGLQGLWTSIPWLLHPSWLQKPRERSLNTGTPQETATAINICSEVWLTRWSPTSYPLHDWTANSTSRQALAMNSLHHKLLDCRQIQVLAYEPKPSGFSTRLGTESKASMQSLPLWRQSRRNDPVCIMRP